MSKRPMMSKSSWELFVNIESVKLKLIKFVSFHSNMQGEPMINAQQLGLVMQTYQHGAALRSDWVTGFILYFWLIDIKLCFVFFSVNL